MSNYNLILRLVSRPTSRTFFILIHEIIFDREAISFEKHRETVNKNKELWKWVGCSLIE